jgi:MFS superfamily sulfate permease-like transporter
MTNFSKQLSTAFVLFLVGFMESISISKALARKNKYEISVQQEIVSMGLANLFGAMFSSYSTTGSFSRSAVSADIGAKTGLQGAVTGVDVMSHHLKVHIHLRSLFHTGNSETAEKQP